MKKRKLIRTFLAACSAVALSAVVYGCGGGGGGPAMPGDVDFSGVTGGYTVETGTWTLGAGETVTVGDVTFLCTPGGAGCTLTVLDNGMATYAGDGGVVTAANSAAYGARQEQRAAAGATIAAATTAVAALTVGSADAAVTAAEQAIATAKAAVAAGTMLTTADLAALNGQIAEAEASLATVRTAIADRKTHDSQLSAATAAVAAAKSAVEALDRMSTDAAIASAQALIDAAAKAVSDGTLLTDDEKTEAAGKITASMALLGKVTVEAKIHAADSAIAGLTAASTDAEVDAAQAAISAATAALRKVQQSLTGPQAIAFGDSIDAAKAALAAKRTQIADSKTHLEQLAVLDAAVSAAKTAVDALDRMSTAAAIAAAQARMDAAVAAVAAGTKLTAEEKSAANERITASMAVLERVTVEAGIHAAETAVGGLSATSSDADLAAAQAAIDTAAAALGKVTLLSAKQALAFRDSIDAARAALETARANVAGSRERQKQLAAVNAAVSAAQAAVAALTAGSTDADAAGAAGKVQAAKDAVSAGTALTAEDKASAATTITAAETALATRRAAITARRDEARAMSAALRAAPGTTFDANLDAIDGGTVSIAGYEKAADDTAPAIAGWAGSVYEDVTRAVDGTTVIERDTVVVYTDKVASKSASYTAYYLSGADGSAHLTDPNHASYVAPSDGFRWVVWNAVVASVSPDNKGVISFNSTQVTAADAARLFSSSGFPARGLLQTYPDGDSATEGVQVAFAGSFHGVAGRFECTAVSGVCTAVTGIDGALTLAGANASWTFVPTATNVSVAGAQEGADYLDFGYWVQWDADGGAGNAPAYTVEAFFRGKDPHTAVDAVEGTARYSGKAAGLYARQVYEGNTLLDDRWGRFTADVALQAYFGGRSVAVDNQNSIGGTVSNFMDGGQPIDSGWTVTLNRIQSGTGDQTWNDSNMGAFSGGTTAGGGAAGTWSGQFFGDATVDGNGVTPQPSSVAGEFTAGFHNGEVAGAFGARKQ